MNQVRRCLTFRVSMRHPGDTSAVTALIERGEVRAEEIVAIFGKTEGNGCVNDFTRAYAVSALKAALAPALGCSPDEVGERVAMIMSGGTEGGLSPHFLVLARGAAPSSAAQADRKTLAIGTTFTRAFLPEEIGRAAQIHATAEAVRNAMTEAGIDDPADVHFVQVKCPASHLRADRRCNGARQERLDPRHLRVDGPVPRRLGARNRLRAG